MDTRTSLLAKATECFKKVHEAPNYNLSEPQAMRLIALAEAGKGFILLAQELDKPKHLV